MFLFCFFHSSSGLCFLPATSFEPQKLRSPFVSIAVASHYHSHMRLLAIRIPITHNFGRTLRFASRYEFSTRCVCVCVSMLYTILNITMVVSLT